MIKERSGMSRSLRGWLIVITGTLSVLAGISAHRVIQAPRPAAIRPAEPMESEVVVYKSATCECCGRWVEHLERAGMRVSVHVVENLAEPKARLGVPARLGSCHTATVGGYARGARPHRGDSAPPGRAAGCHRPGGARYAGGRAGDGDANPAPAVPGAVDRPQRRDGDLASGDSRPDPVARHR
jgi:hypothetical protein